MHFRHRKMVATTVIT